MRVAIVVLLGSTVAYADGEPTPTPKPKQTASIEAPSTSDTNTVEQKAQPSTMDLGDVKFELHGYPRMPLAARLPREPYLVDNDYYLSGFSYTRLYEPDWSELFFSAKKGDYKVELGMFASLYSRSDEHTSELQS